MEAICCPSSSAPLRSQNIQKLRSNLPQLFPKKGAKLTHTLASYPRLRAAALGDGLILAATNSPAAGGDVSVLIPISVVLLLVYWIANFVVPEMIMKDLQQGTAEGDEAESANK
ncbi:uncharacterized protein LOC109713103 [Ananas comosus]|uniref:Uncharacterized protein LOC109713103 n=1 Tax=Ananas comosus TaxID=4615 RepID=A0A6P5F8Z5_ANACO|nr:uncharacterized protein LOC109713103 [Ananas comosus]